MEDGTELTIHHNKNSDTLQADEIDININEEKNSADTNENATNKVPETNPPQSTKNGKALSLEESPSEVIPEVTEAPSITDTSKKDYPLPNPRISEMTPPAPPQPSPDTAQPEEKKTDSDIPDLFEESDEELSEKKKSLEKEKNIPEIDEDIPEIEEIDPGEIEEDDEIEDEPDMPID